MARRDSDELSPTEAALLAFLTSGEKSGYDLARAFDRSIAFIWAPAKGHMYAILPRLVESGLATSREVVQETRPNKQLYRITRRGRSTLQRWLERPLEAEPGRNMLLVKVFFGHLAGDETILGHVRRRKEEAEALERQMREFDRQAEELGARELYPWLTRRYAVLWARAVVQWAREAEEAIAAQSTGSSRSMTSRRR